MKPSKLTVFEHVLLDGQCWVHFDARWPGVVVPRKFKTRAHVVLTFGYSGDVPTLGLQFDEDAVSGVLFFSGEPCLCRVPWSAVFGLRRADGMGTYWAESAPETLEDERTAQSKPIRLLQGGGHGGRIVERRLRLVSPGC